MANPPAFRIDVAFINPFIDGTVETLKIQCSLASTPGKPFLKGGQALPKIDIAAVIGLASSAFKGSIAICFPQKVFLALMGKMLSDTYTQINKELEDGAGELLNIIFGQAKRVLNEKGYGIEKAIPAIIRGQDLEVRHLTASPTLILPFETDAGPFHIEVATE